MIPFRLIWTPCTHAFNSLLYERFTKERAAAEYRSAATSRRNPRTSVIGLPENAKISFLFDEIPEADEEGEDDDDDDEGEQREGQPKAFFPSPASSSRRIAFASTNAILPGRLQHNEEGKRSPSRASVRSDHARGEATVKTFQEQTKMLNAKLAKFQTLAKSRKRGLRALRKHFRRGDKEAVAAMVTEESRRGGGGHAGAQARWRRRRLPEADGGGNRTKQERQNRERPEPVRFRPEPPTRRRKNAVQERSSIAADIHTVTEKEHRDASNEWAHRLTILFQDKLKEQMRDLGRDSNQSKREQKIRLKNVVNEYSNKVARVMKKWVNIRHANKKMHDDDAIWDDRMRAATAKNKKLQEQLDALELECEDLRLNGEARVKDERMKLDALKRDLSNERTREPGLREQIQRAATELQKAKAELAGAKHKLGTVAKPQLLEATQEIERYRRRLDAVKQNIQNMKKAPLLVRQLHKLQELYDNEFYVQEEIANDLTCKVCMDTLKEPVALWPCGHVFCKECVDKSTVKKERKGPRTSYMKVSNKREVSATPGLFRCPDCQKNVPSKCVRVKQAVNVTELVSKVPGDLRAGIEALLAELREKVEEIEGES